MPAIVSNQVRGLRRIGTQAVLQDNSVFQFDVPRGPAIEGMLIQIAGSITVTTAFTSVRLQAPIQLVKRADWLINGSTSLDSVSGYLAQANWMRHNLTILTPPSNFTTATYPISMSFWLDRSMTDGVRPKDSMLKTDVGLSSNQIRLTMGALADMFGGAGVATYAGLTVTMSSKDYQEARSATGNTPTPSFYLKRSQFDIAIPATTQNQQQKLSTGNRLRAILFRPNVGSATQTYGDVSTAVMNNITLSRAGDTRVNIQYSTLQSSNAAEFPVVFTGNTQYNGYVVVDLAAGGLLGGTRYSEFWPIPSTADTFLTLDVNGGTYNQVSLMVLEGVDLVQPK